MESGKVSIKGKISVGRPDRRHGRRRRRQCQRRRGRGRSSGSACPTCGSCSGMFTANSMNCLTEALGLALPGNGSVLATHADRKGLFVEAGHLIVDLARRYYEQDDETALPRSIASFKAFENAMTLDIAMGGSTNTVLHLLAAAHEGQVPFTMQRHRSPVATRAGAVQGGALGARRASGRRASRRRRHGDSGRARSREADPRRAADGAQRDRLRTRSNRWDIVRTPKRKRPHTSTWPRPAACRRRWPSARTARFDELDIDRAAGCIRDVAHAYSRRWRSRGAVRATSPPTAAS